MIFSFNLLTIEQEVLLICVYLIEITMGLHVNKSEIIAFQESNTKKLAPTLYLFLRYRWRGNICTLAIIPVP